jgi:quinohemoprotein ethanol dehydrogenase
MQRWATLLIAMMMIMAARAATVVDNRALADENNGANWASYGRTFSESHYSPLKQINANNISRLKLAWYYDIEPVANTFEAPLAVDGVLYFALGYSVVHAMDAKTGKLLWRYDPKAPEASGRKLRAGWGNRGIAYWKGLVYTATHDGRLLAINARTGKLVWSVLTTEPGDSTYITGVPWAFNGKVVIGFAGGDYEPVRGYVTAYDAATGKRAWRFYTVPGDPKKPFEDEAMAMAATTWSGDWWRFGGTGGTAWQAFAYDPEFNRVYFGTGNGWPWNTRIRGDGGDNLFLASIVAVDADTGKYAWHYQVVPSEIWDYDAASDLQLITLTIAGEQRPVLMQAGKNGFFYVIDRRNGKLISANGFTTVTWAERIDLASGRPVERPGARFDRGVPQVIFPGYVGAHAVHAMSFNRDTGLVYIPTIDMGGLYSDPAGDLKTWQPNPGMVTNTGLGKPLNPPVVPPGKSFLKAWNPLTQREAWSVPLGGTVNGSTMTTAGNLVMQGQVTGEISIYAADTGTKLWSFDAQTGVTAQPISYLAGGRQYITLIAGWRGQGGNSGVPVERDYRLQPRRVLTFTLDGAAKLPVAGVQTSNVIDDPAFTVDPAKAAVGDATYNANCRLCHGAGLMSGGTAPDLRKSAIPLSNDAVTAVLHDGALVPRGMPRYEELAPAQIEGLQHYIRQQARVALAAAR